MRMSEKFKLFLRNLWKGNSLDIRCTNNGRWYDQKVTPDVMSAICDVIAKESRRNPSFRPFSIQSIWASASFKEQVVDNFSKPNPRNPGAVHEYDKFIAQPLNVLSAAGILAKSQGNRGHLYDFPKKAENFIAEMADSEMFSCDFLLFYISESLRQSGLDGDFEKFFNCQDEASFVALKSRYARFITGHTPINGKVECHRVFAKVLNVCAFSRKAKGARCGRLSKTPITLSDIRYNRTNIRDDAAKKPKNIPRQIWELSSDHPIHGARVVTSRKGRYGARKVIKDVKSFHQNKPEISDSYSGVDLPGEVTVEGHHILPRSKYPRFGDMRENIILLTPTQHSSHAHGGEYQIDPAYQGFCLLQKLDAIIACENDPNCNFYSFDAFKKMLSLAGTKDESILCAKKLDTYKYDDVKREIFRFYGKKTT